jgi:hypothetical protein
LSRVDLICSSFTLCILCRLEVTREITMKKTSRKTNNFADALATELQFAVLTKPGRIQILVEPTPKQLRKRGKRGWQLFGTVDQQSDSRQLLDEILQKALFAAENADGATGRKQKRLKAAKAPAKE